MRIVYQGKIDSTFEGFDENKIFKMSNGMYWVQAKYRYWYHYAYRPNVIITQEDGKYMLEVEGQKIQVKRLENVIESNIDGEFTGWDSDKVYRLTNSSMETKSL